MATGHIIDRSCKKGARIHQGDKKTGEDAAPLAQNRSPWRCRSPPATPTAPPTSSLLRLTRLQSSSHAPSPTPAICSASPAPAGASRSSAPAAHRCAASGGTAAAAQQVELWPIAEEAARRWVLSCTDQERGWVPHRGRKSWLGLMWEVQSLRRGAVFGRSHEYITLSEGGSRATVHADGIGCTSAASKAVMRAGRHYVQFTVMSGNYILFGVIRPGWDVEGGKNAHCVDGHCFYDTYDGQRYPGGHDWEGKQGAREGDRIGMLLDLDQGSMTVYKNDERLGVMATGLSGEYSWAVDQCLNGESALIRPAALPGE